MGCLENFVSHCKFRQSRDYPEFALGGRMSKTADDVDTMEKMKAQGFDWRAFTPEDSPLTPMDVMADPRHKDLSTPSLAPGDPAYNFTSAVYDFSEGVEVHTGNTFDLLDAAREKPVALIFGSYT
jgi:hypothetical protein